MELRREVRYQVGIQEHRVEWKVLYVPIFSRIPDSEVAKTEKTNSLNLLSPFHFAENLNLI